ncbi:MAG: hypothetical protein ABI647_11985 [Gemmatimonadota bacterium]
MKRIPSPAWLLAIAAASCSGRTDRGDDAAEIEAAPASHLCSLLAAEEIEGVLGGPVGPGMVAGPGGTACQWDGMGGRGFGSPIFAQARVINDKRFWSPPTEVGGYEPVRSVGTEAYVVPDIGGWTAGALTDSSVVTVTLNGGTADRGHAVKLLRILVARMK